MKNSPAAYEFRNEHPDWQIANKAVHAFCSKIQTERQAIRYALARIGTLDCIDDMITKNMFSHDSLSNENDQMLEDITGNDREVWMDKVASGRECIVEMQLKVAHDVVRHDNKIKQLKRQQDLARAHADAIGERIMKEFENAQNKKEKQKV